MSASLVLLIGTAAIVWPVCFVGCNLGHAGPSSAVVAYYQYQNTVTTTRGLVACWPLDDTSGTVATDLRPNGFNGAYTSGPIAAYNAAQQSDGGLLQCRAR